MNPKSNTVHRRLMLAGTSLVAIVSALALAGTEAGAEPLPPPPNLDFVTVDYGSNSTFFTGIRGDNLVGNYVLPGTADTGGLLYRSDTGTWVPFTEATANGVNFPDAYSSSPYGPSFGSMGGILRVVVNSIPIESLQPAGSVADESLSRSRILHYARPDTLMKALMELNYQTSLPVPVIEGGRLLGVVGNREIYRGVLRKREP